MKYKESFYLSCLITTILLVLFPFLGLISLFFEGITSEIIDLGYLFLLALVVLYFYKIIQFGEKTKIFVKNKKIYYLYYVYVPIFLILYFIIDALIKTLEIKELIKALVMIILIVLSIFMVLLIILYFKKHHPLQSYNLKEISINFLGYLNGENLKKNYSKFKFLFRLSLFFEILIIIGLEFVISGVFKNYITESNENNVLLIIGGVAILVGLSLGIYLIISGFINGFINKFIWIKILCFLVWTLYFYLELTFIFSQYLEIDVLNEFIIYQYDLSLFGGYLIFCGVYVFFYPFEIIYLNHLKENF